MHRQRPRGIGGIRRIKRHGQYFCLVNEFEGPYLPPTEQEGPVKNLEQLSLSDLVRSMHDHSDAAHTAVSKCLPQIEAFLEALIPRMQQGGRLFYIGAGTSGRLGVVDASECPPTFGVAQDAVQGWIAGGDGALRVAVEGAEDDMDGAWKDLKSALPAENDTLVGIAASGRTPYVIGGLRAANAAGLLTGCITCNPDSIAEKEAQFPMVAVTGPEFITGSTRLNAGTATKLILNLITTTAMVQLGHVRGSKMIDMQLSNLKLVERGVRMISEATGCSATAARAALDSAGNVRDAIDQLSGHAHT